MKLLRGARLLSLGEMRRKAISNNYNTEGRGKTYWHAKRKQKGVIRTKGLRMGRDSLRERVNRPLCASIGMLPRQSAKLCVHTREIKEAFGNLSRGAFCSSNLSTATAKLHSRKFSSRPVQPAWHGNRYCIVLYRLLSIPTLCSVRISQSECPSV